VTLVVSDASPLNYLVLVGVQEILPNLYGSILVPDQVIDELKHAGTPAVVSQWASHLPDWIEVRLGDSSRFPTLDVGEAAALAMAIGEHARLLVDESEARSMAGSFGVSVIGTVGIVAEAHLKSLLDFDTTIQALAATNFRAHANVISTVRQGILARQPEPGGKQGE
jgi:predicted nucleic acid-binding protein